MKASPFNRPLKFIAAFICIGCGAEIEVHTLQVIVDSIAGQPVVCRTEGCGEKYTVNREGAIPHSVVKHMREQEGHRK